MVDTLISAVIATFNRAWCLKSAVDSVLSQKGVNFELIVVDDGSTDQTEQVLRPYVEEKKLKVLVNPERLGVSAARNRGIIEAKGSLIAFLDSDDVWLEDKLRLQEEYMSENPNYPISQCLERWIRNGKRVNPGLRHQKIEGSIFIPSLSLCLISPSAAIVKADLFDKVGLFDETLPACEDYDLWLRILAHREVGLLKKELVERRAGHSDQLSTLPGLDRYRIRALKKILGLPLPPQFRAAALIELKRRRSIYEAGRRKRVQGEAKLNLT
ncbi:MAG: glycosyltransferase [Deltaproteobacteria bacterium]|jgi:glycosyltransferase involved in cell wall biosynthesis|nr:glycosyltransferase [Deltaproteobacteria bacterium]